MATMTHSESRRLYSWWWDSHISPKNSKWLQDNLTDIDAKVKTMIKLIEEDADSFARRAEMYYKKRPELMKLVEEFYRAYRALAERYDHATGELRHAQRAMAAAFPNQVPFPFADDPQSLNSDDFGTDESKAGLKQLQEMFVALENSKLGEEKERDYEGELSHLSDENRNLKDRASKAENEIEILQKALESLHCEKEGVLHRYDESVNKFFNLEKELDGAQMSLRGLDEEASQAKAEVEKLKEALLRLERERDNALSKLNEYRERISKLEAVLYQSQKDEEGLMGRVVKAEAETQYLEEEVSSLKTENKGLMGHVIKVEAETQYLEEKLSKLKVENNAVSSEYQQCLDRVSDLEKKLLLTQEKANAIDERADRAENEVRALNKVLFEASEDKKGIVCLYEHCLEKISKLENELSRARDDIRRLIGDMKLKNEMLKSVEEKCAVLKTSNHALKLEANNLERIITTKNEELSKKDEEIERARLGLRNEHIRFVQAEATLQTLRNLHSQAQREQKGLALELKNGLKMLKEMEEKKHGLEEEIFQVKDENKILNESNLSSKVAMENLESEILTLKEMKERLEREVGLQMGQTNTLQKEIHNLNEDIVSLNTRYKGVIKQIESVGIDPENLESTMKDLLDQNLELRQLCDKEIDEKQNFVKKLENMKQFVDKNAILEDSLTALSGELEKSQEKVEALRGEKSYLVDEKAVILSQLQAISESMQKLLERNTFLEKSLSGANIELLSLREKANCLEELCKSLNNDKSNLLNETNTLVVQLGNVEQRLENLENKFAVLEVSYAGLEKERESTLSQVVELKTCLDIEKRERVSLTLSSETRLTRLEDHVQLLQEENKSRKKEFEEELDRVVNAQFEIFVLQRFIQDMEQKNLSLLLECQKHVEASKLSDKVISELESENLEQQVETEFLLDEIEKLRVGVYQVLKALGVSPDHGLVDKMENDNLSFDNAVENIEDLKFSLSNYKDDIDQLWIENSVFITLFGQLKLEVSEFALEKNNLQNRFKITSEQLVVEQNEKKKIIEINSQLNSDVKLRDQLTDKLKAEIEMVGNNEREMKKAYLKLHNEYSQKLEENRSLLKTLLDLKEKKNMVEEENHSILIEALALDNKSIVFKQFGDEKVEEVKSLSKVLQIIDGQKCDLETEIGKMKSELNLKEDQNMLLECWVKKLDDELDDIRDINSQLTDELSISKSFSKHEMELLIMTEKLKAKEELNSQLCRIVEGLKRKIEGTEVKVENLEQCNLALSQENKNQKNEIENLREISRFLDSEVDMLKKEVEERKIREEKLSLELKEISNEFQMWEAEAETFHFDLQISTIREFFLENKVHELSCVCEKVENERDSKMAEIEKMTQLVSFLESEVGGLKGQLLAYDPVIDTLRDNVISLEKKILSQQELNMQDIRRSEDVEFAIDLHEKSSNDLMENEKLLVPNGVSELQHLQNRIKEVEKVVTEEMKRHGKQKTPKTSRKLEAAMREIEDIKANCSLRFEKANDKLLRKTKSEFFEMKNGIVSTKDIPLDNISNDLLYGISRRRFQRTDDQMLELWETSEDDHSLGRIKTKPIGAVNLSRRFESIDTSMELQAEKELGVDRLEVPTSGTESTQDRNKRKILERLSSDAQKLKSIKTTVEDLRRKMEESATKKKAAKNVDFNTVKEQLEEVEDTSIQLVEVNEKLMKNVEDNAYLSDKKASPELEVIVNLRRKRVAEQTRKESEKIGRLLIEVHKIQYILSKVEDEKKRLGNIRFSKSKTSIIFKDLISGRRRNSPKRKKACLCGCFRTTSNREGKSISDFNRLRYE